MPTRFHSHTQLHPLCRQITVELLRFLAVQQSPLLQFPSLGIYKSNLLEARVVICSYNQHIGSFSPEPFWLVSATKVYSGLGADIVMEPINKANEEPTTATNHYGTVQLKQKPP